MSKMREAFEALYISMPANIKPDSNEWHAELMCRVFEAGYQAAIAAVREGGAQAWIEHHKAGDNINWEQCDHPYAQATPLYKLPED